MALHIFRLEQGDNYQNRENAKFWPILAILLQISALVGVLLQAEIMCWCTKVDNIRYDKMPKGTYWSGVGETAERMRKCFSGKTAITKPGISLSQGQSAIFAEQQKQLRI